MSGLICADAKSANAPPFVSADFQAGAVVHRRFGSSQIRIRALARRTIKA
jgi:hypothetical protein